MLDLSFIRQNLDQVRQKMQDRGMPMALDEFEALDLERRRLIQESESLKHLRNKTNDEITSLKKQQQDASSKIAEMKEVSARIKLLDEELSTCDEKLRALQLVIPNIPHPTVPVGNGCFGQFRSPSGGQENNLPI